MYIRRTNSGKYEIFVDIAPKGSKKRKRATKTFSTRYDAKCWAMDKKRERRLLS